MNKQNWNINQDGCTIDSTVDVMVPWLGISLPVWFEIEDDQNWWTEWQEKSFETFLQLDSGFRQILIEALQDCFTQELKEERIKSFDYEDILESINWKETQICIPHLYNSPNQYVIMLPETKWELVDSDYTLELEILFVNGSIELAQEMSGIWNRLEWLDYYVKREYVSK